MRLEVHGSCRFREWEWWTATLDLEEKKSGFSSPKSHLPGPSKDKSRFKYSLKATKEMNSVRRFHSAPQGPAVGASMTRPTTTTLMPFTTMVLVTLAPLDAPMNLRAIIRQQQQKTTAAAFMRQTNWIAMGIAWWKRIVRGCAGGRPWLMPLGFAMGGASKMQMAMGFVTMRTFA
jgi:hypothetical protein